MKSLAGGQGRIIKIDQLETRFRKVLDVNGFWALVEHSIMLHVFVSNLGYMLGKSRSVAKMSREMMSLVDLRPRQESCKTHDQVQK